MALIGVFESLRHWLLYDDIVVRWGTRAISAYSYTRDGLSSCSGFRRPMRWRLVICSRLHSGSGYIFDRE